MKRTTESDDLLLADRLVNYADAITALAFLGFSGFGVLVADSDTRCSVVSARTEITFGLLSSSLVFSAIVVVFHRWVAVLRAEEPMSSKAARYHRYLHVSRLVVIWLAAFLSILVLPDASESECPDDAAAPREARAEWRSIPSSVVASGELLTTGRHIGRPERASIPRTEDLA